MDKQRFTCRLPCSKCAGQKQCSSIQKPPGHGCSIVHNTKHTEHAEMLHPTAWTCTNISLQPFLEKTCLNNMLLHSLSPSITNNPILRLVFQSCEQPRRKQSKHIFVFPPSLTINLLNIQFWPWLIWPYCASILALAMGQAVRIDVLINGSFRNSSTNPFTNNQREVMAHKKQESVWCFSCEVVLYNSRYFSEQISVLNKYLTKVLLEYRFSERSWQTEQFRGVTKRPSFICSPPLSLSWAIRSSGGMPSMPYISSSMLSRPVMALGTFVTISLCTWEQWMASPGAV